MCRLPDEVVKSVGSEAPLPGFESCFCHIMILGSFLNLFSPSLVVLIFCFPCTVVVLMHWYYMCVCTHTHKLVATIPRNYSINVNCYFNTTHSCSFSLIRHLLSRSCTGEWARVTTWMWSGEYSHRSNTSSWAPVMSKANGCTTGKCVFFNLVYN